MRDQDNNCIEQQKDDPYYAEMGRIERYFIYADPYYLKISEWTMNNTMPPMCLPPFMRRKRTKELFTDLQETTLKSTINF